MKIILSTLITSALVVGCTAPSLDGGLRESDLRTKNYEYLDDHVYMDLPAVQRQLFIHREACEIDFVFRKDPLQVHFATLLYGPVGVTDLKDQVMLDLTAYATGKLGIKGYTYYNANKKKVRELMAVLGKPTICPEGIVSKVSLDSLKIK